MISQSTLDYEAGPHIERSMKSGGHVIVPQERPAARSVGPYSGSRPSWKHPRRTYGRTARKSGRHKQDHTTETNKIDLDANCEFGSNSLWFVILGAT